MMKYTTAVMLLMTAPALAAGKTAGTDEKAAAAEGGPGVSGPEITLNVPIFSPLFTGVPVATVNEEPISLGDLTDTLAIAHTSKSTARAAGKTDYLDILNRMINSRLIVDEAKNMGLDELPEMKAAMDAYPDTLMRAMVLEKALKDVKPDEAMVEKIYREDVREYEIKSVFFDKEEDAKKAEDQIKSGADFDKAVAKAIEDKTAHGGDSGYMKPKNLLPQVQEAVVKMKTGSVSPIIKVGAGKKVGFVLLKLEDIRYPDDTAAREKAQAEAYRQTESIAEGKYVKGLVDKYVKANSKLIVKLDYESKKPGLEKLAKDRRVIVRIKGEKPITVADLTAALKKHFFHGMKAAIEGKDVNNAVVGIVDTLIREKILKKEALRLGIDKTGEFKKRLKEHGDSLLFGAFVQKVIIPEVKVSEEEMKGYYEKHKDDYTSPAVVKMSILAFSDKKAAQGAIEKLNKGTDFQWLKENAEDQVKEGKEEFEGGTYLVKELPEGMQQALDNANAGDARLYESAHPYFYVMHVKSFVRPKTEAFDVVKGKISQKLSQEKVMKDLDDWAGKLKQHYPVRIFVAGNENETKDGKK